ncbi:carbohydrate sulfotransferase 11-like [Lytechinus variegatus]|uniref:carbohydrate sulfotransferase 11-like n=1 Tax=Lytechinus variegatus TaxID=7654 RepID=UPI001BB15F7B|nr:carbohydrate sulfotransferase 11-like [Lytechinus variegatus]
MLIFALLLLVIRSRSLGASEHMGPYGEGAISNHQNVMGFNINEAGRRTSVVMKDRIDYLQEECIYNMDSHRDPALDPPKELIVNERYGIIYCNVPKVGCTNWKSVFLKIGGIDDIRIKALQRLPTNTRGRIYLDYFHQYTNISHRQFMLRKFTKFMFSRHPFTRVLSAFRDKLAPNNSLLFQRKWPKQDVNWIERYGIPIIEKYRGAEAAAFIKPNLRTKYDLKFSEFVDYLIDTNPLSFDKHWNLVSVMCRPCDVKYDIIGKYETLDDDADFILRSANVDPSVKYPQASKSATNSSSLDILKKYYSQLTRDQLQKLYEVYKRDFELFDYSLEAFYKYLS